MLLTFGERIIIGMLFLVLANQGRDDAVRAFVFSAIGFFCMIGAVQAWLRGRKRAP